MRPYHHVRLTAVSRNLTAAAVVGISLATVAESAHCGDVYPLGRLQGMVLEYGYLGIGERVYVAVVVRKRRRCAFLGDVLAEHPNARTWKWPRGLRDSGHLGLAAHTLSP
ncbi:hypothetical protein DFH28DRAFT_1140198 [Melampsora americana]|nr:hypothetical protein DFH28DRAFT_1140198 [Melampsora americana]